jgi:hypothetical protein
MNFSSDRSSGIAPPVSLTESRLLDRVRLRGLVFGSFVVFATILLFLISRGKWSDAIIDSGREWIVPDSLSRGELLYRDVVYWFGPWTPYFHAAFFRVLGSGFGTLVVAGVVGSLAILVLLNPAVRRVAGKTEAAVWTALAVPALVFMPNAGGSILGMGYRIWHAAAFALGAVVLAAAPAPNRRPLLRLAGIGSLCALSGLCRAEWGAVSLLAALLALQLRSRSRRDVGNSSALVVAVSVLGFGATIVAFCLAAGRDAVLKDGHVLLTDLPRETREFAIAFSGLRSWGSGLAEMVYSTAMWLGVFLVVFFLASHKRDPAVLRRNGLTVVSLLAVLGCSAALGGAGGGVVFSAAPIICLAGLGAGIVRGHSPRAAALAACGLAGLLLSYRRPFHITDSAYVGPPLLFAFACAAGLAHLAIVRQRTAPARRRLRGFLLGAVGALVVLSFASRAFHYAGDERVPIPGTNGMLSARPELARELETLTAALQEATIPAGRLVVFPEGEVLNFLSGRANPIRHKLYIPGYLTDANEEQILEELRHEAPDAIVVWSRPSGEYGRSSFGGDYGSRIWRWIQEDYRPLAVEVPRPRGEVFVGVRHLQAHAGE